MTTIGFRGRHSRRRPATLTLTVEEARLLRAADVLGKAEVREIDGELQFRVGGCIGWRSIVSLRPERAIAESGPLQEALWRARPAPETAPASAARRSHR